ncbi:hypothetical protein MMC09_003149 [Bachmanniomyces sp. S44760]|nr:hypothetical protein [Bachmanniomyces sp. S44760]
MVASSTLLEFSTSALTSLWKNLPESVQSLIAQAYKAAPAYLPSTLADHTYRLNSDNSLAVLITCLSSILIILFSMSSWLRGRFSPYNNAPISRSPPRVTEDDYHYLGPEDIVDPPRPPRTHAVNDSYGFPATGIRGPIRNESREEPDVLVLKHKGTAYPLHFPAFAIGEGILRVGELRQVAAGKIGGTDPRRVKLLYKGRILKDDAVACREEGLKQNSELMCVISEAAPTRPDDESSESADEEEMIAAVNGGGPRVDVDGTLIGGPSSSGRRKKRSHRSGKKKSGRDSGRESSPATLPRQRDTSYLAPEGPHPSQQSISGSASTRSSSPQPPPKTPIAKIEEISSIFHTQFVPLCIKFTTHPPPDTKTRDYEYKKLSETILAQILIKLDGVETEGDEKARARRKDLVKETQAMLNSLDAVGKQ